MNRMTTGRTTTKRTTKKSFCTVPVLVGYPIPPTTATTNTPLLLTHPERFLPLREGRSIYATIALPSLTKATSKAALPTPSLEHSPSRSLTKTLSTSPHPDSIYGTTSVRCCRVAAASTKTVEPICVTDSRSLGAGSACAVKRSGRTNHMASRIRTETSFGVRGQLCSPLARPTRMPSSTGLGTCGFSAISTTCVPVSMKDTRSCSGSWSSKISIKRRRRRALPRCPAGPSTHSATRAWRSGTTTLSTASLFGIPGVRSGGP